MQERDLHERIGAQSREIRNSHRAVDQAASGVLCGLPDPARRNLMRVFQVRLTAARAAFLAALLLLTFVASVGVALRLPAKYSAKAEAVLIGPSLTDGKPTNPYMQFSQALSVVADVLKVASSDADTARQIVRLGGTNSYVVERLLGASEPIITVTGEARTPQQAITTTTLVVKFLTADLKRRQDAADVSVDDRVKLVTITTPEQASRQWKTPIEIGVGVLVLGLVGSLILFVVVARFLVRREGKRRAATKRIAQAQVRSRKPRSGWRPIRVVATRAAGRARRGGPIEVTARASAQDGVRVAASPENGARTSGENGSRVAASSGNGARASSQRGGRQRGSGDRQHDTVELARVTDQARTSQIPPPN
jgi:hypothetical protein